MSPRDLYKNGVDIVVRLLHQRLHLWSSSKGGMQSALDMEMRYRFEVMIREFQSMFGLNMANTYVTCVYIQIRITLPAIVNAIHENPTIDGRSFSTLQLSPLEK